MVTKNLALGPVKSGEKKNLTVPELADRLSVSVRFAWELVNKRQIASVRLGRTVRVRPDDIEKFIQQNTVPSLVAEKTSEAAKEILAGNYQKGKGK